MPKSFSVLRHRDYAVVQGANAISMLGTWMQYVGIGWALRGLSDWEFVLGLSFVAQFGPALLLSPVSGVVADRVDRRLVVLFGNLAMAFPPLLTGVFITSDMLTVRWLLAFTTLGGFGLAFTQPASQAVLPALVPAEEIPQAVSFGAAAINLTRVVGPAIGGLVIKGWGLDWAFYLNGVSFLAVVVAWWFVRPPGTRPVSTGAHEGYFERLRRGVEYARRDYVVRRLLGLNAVVAIFVFHAPLMPVFAKDVLAGDEFTYSVLTLATGIGAVVGALMGGELTTVNQRRGAIAGGALTASLGLLSFAVSKSLLLSSACLVVFGVGYFLLLSMSQAVMMLVLPDEFRGRVMGLLSTVSIGGVPLAGLLAGSLASWLGPQTTVIIGSSVMLLYAALFAATAVRNARFGMPVGDGATGA